MSLYRELPDELALWVHRVRHRDRIRGQLAAQRRRLFEADKRLHALGRAAAKVEADLLRLQGASLQGLYARLVGGLDTRVDAERRTAVAARLRYAQQHQLAATVRAEVSRLDTELRASGDVDHGYRMALQCKAQTLAARDDTYGRAIVNVVEQLAHVRGAAAEVQAVRRSGMHALEHLDACRSTLSRLGMDWNTNRVLPGLATADDLNAAATEASEAQLHLQHFRLGLADVDESLLASQGPKDSVRFTADFVDGLIVDWTAERKISHAKGSLDEIIADVRRATDALEQAATRAATEIDGLWQRFVSLVATG